MAVNVDSLAEVFQTPDENTAHVAQFLEWCSDSAGLALTNESQLAVSRFSRPALKVHLVAKGDLLAIGNISRRKTLDIGVAVRRRPASDLWNLAIWYTRMIDP